MGVALPLPLLSKASPMAAHSELKPARHPGAADGRVLVWTSTERGEGRSFAGSTLVLALGGPPRLVAGSCLQQLQVRLEPGEGEGDRHLS